MRAMRVKAAVNDGLKDTNATAALAGFGMSILAVVALANDVWLGTVTGIVGSGAVLYVVLAVVNVLGSYFSTPAGEVAPVHAAELAGRKR